jgi:hypothetical protein
MLDLAATYLRFAEWLEGKHAPEKIDERGEILLGPQSFEYAPQRKAAQER